MGRRRCFVPLCQNTSDDSNKKFISVPRDEETRQIWFKTVGRSKYLKTSYIFCCEDHFDLPNDAENYIRQKYLAGTPVKLKPGVVPHRHIKNQVCRLCWTTLTDDDEMVPLATAPVSFKDMLKYCLPELDFELTLEPAFCSGCVQALESFYHIKKNALAQEVKLVSLMKRKLDSIEVEELANNDYKLDLTACYTELNPETALVPPRVQNKKRKREESKENYRNKIEKQLQKIIKGHEETMEDGRGESVNTVGQQIMVIEEPENDTNDEKVEEFALSDFEAGTLVKGTSVLQEGKHNIKSEESEEQYCQVVYLDEESGTQSYTTVNVVQLLDSGVEGMPDSNCLFCDNYTGTDIMTHGVSHVGNSIKCNLCSFICENADEESINQHIYVHSVLSGEGEEEIK